MLMRFPCSCGPHHFVTALTGSYCPPNEFYVVYVIVVHCHVATRLHVKKTLDDLCESHSHQELKNI